MGILDWIWGKRATSTGDATTDEPGRRLHELDAALAFARAMYGELAGGGGNLFLSPASIVAALAMAAAGARGETAAEMTRALRTEPSPDRLPPMVAWLLEAAHTAVGAELSVANTLWAQQGGTLRPEYLSLVRETYSAMI